MQVSLRIELAPLVVETVREFVTNHQANAAEVDVVVHGLVEKWRLQNTGRENNFVERPVVIRVDRGRSHAPLLAIQRFVDLMDIALSLEFIRARDVADQVVPLDRDRAVIAPHIGIANLVANRIELHFGLLLGFLAHPGKIVDVFRQRFLQRVHHFQHALFAVRSESHVHVSLPQCFAQFAVSQVDAAFPARLHLLLAGEVLQELEIGLHEGVRKPRRCRVQQVPAHVGLERIQRLRFQRGIHLLEKIGIDDVEFGKAGRAHCREIAIEIKIRAQRYGFIASHFMVAVPGITAQRALHGSLGQRGLNPQNSLRGIGRLLRRLPRQRKNLGNIFDQMLAHFLHLCVIVFDVVVTVGQRQAALIDVGDHLVGVVQVGR